MNWIRVAQQIGDDPRLDAMAVTCNVWMATVVGCVVCVLTKLPQHAEDGNVSDVSDAMLERWAQWQGKKGQFAAAFRAEMCNDDGIVRAWERYNGSAMREAKRSMDRSKAYREERKRTKNERVRAAFGTENERGNETRRDETNSNYGVSASPVVVADIPREAAPQAATAKRKRPAEDVVAAFDACRHVVLPCHHDALADLLEAVPNATAWAGILTGMHSGLSAPGNRPTEPHRLGTAIQDFVASGKHRNASPGLFRGFVDRAKAAPTPQSGYTDRDTMRADDLRELRASNERRRQLGQKLIVEPADAGQLDALFPDGRTRPMVAA